MKNGSSSRYYDWYYIEKYPINMGSGTNIPGYLTFAYYGGMPKLNMSNDETAEYFTNVGRYWIEECDIDGWRLDVGDEISHSFMKKFRKAIRSVKKDALIVGEDWQHGRDYLDGDEWDSIMNYSFWRLVKDYVMDSSITASEAVEDIGHIRGMFPSQIFNVLWNLIDTHDTPRFLAMCGNDRKNNVLLRQCRCFYPVCLLYITETNMESEGEMTLTTDVECCGIPNIRMKIHTVCTESLLQSVRNIKI